MNQMDITPEENEDQELALKLFTVLSRAYRYVMSNAEKDIRQHQLNPTEFAVLDLLYHKGPFPLQQVGEKILLTSGSITYVVDQLVKKGYIVRQACPNDRRITYATITQQGKSRMDTIFPDHAKAIEAALAGVSNNEKKQLIELLKKTGKYAKEVQGDPH